MVLIRVSFFEIKNSEPIYKHMGRFFSEKLIIVLPALLCLWHAYSSLDG